MSRVATKRLALAAHWLSRGLGYVETNAVEDAGRLVLVFDDPAEREPELTREFFADAGLQAFLLARERLARTLDRARQEPSRRCVQLPPAHVDERRPRAMRDRR